MTAAENRKTLGAIAGPIDFPWITPTRLTLLCRLGMKTEPYAGVGTGVRLLRGTAVTYPLTPEIGGATHFLRNGISEVSQATPEGLVRAMPRSHQRRHHLAQPLQGIVDDFLSYLVAHFIFMVFDVISPLAQQPPGFSPVVHGYHGVLSTV
jgi:hypothetical protein